MSARARAPSAAGARPTGKCNRASAVSTVVGFGSHALAPAAAAARTATTGAGDRWRIGAPNCTVLSLFAVGLVAVKNARALVCATLPLLGLALEWFRAFASGCATTTTTAPAALTSGYSDRSHTAPADLGRATGRATYLLGFARPIKLAVQ